MKTTLTYSDGVEQKSTTLVFGNTCNKRYLSQGMCQAELFPAELFCLRVYHLELFGATCWALYIAETVSKPGEAKFIPNVLPGARVLLHVRGATKVGQAEKWIEKLSKSSDPTRVHRNLYLKQHAILNTNFTPRVPFKPVF